MSDVIIYADSLVNPEVFRDSRAATVIKTSTMNIDEINETVKRYYEEGKEIARLHSGDPSVYGAINDEIQFFREKDMEFDIIPGISSVFAAAASLGLELTAPGTTQSVILTRVPRRTEYFEKEDLELLAAHKTSLAIFLSASNAKRVSEKLIGAGYSPEDRAIIAYKVSWPDEKIIISTIGTLEHAMFENKINRQALIMIGGNISYHSDKKSYLYNPDFTHLFRKSSKKS